MPIDEPIIVSGGSVTVNFDKEKFPIDSNGRHSASDRRITSVDVLDHSTGNTETVYTAPADGKCTITIHTTT